MILPMAQEFVSAPNIRRYMRVTHALGDLSNEKLGGQHQGANNYHREQQLAPAPPVITQLMAGAVSDKRASPNHR